MPNFEVLDARIASALNKIIHNSHFKRRISLEEQKGPEAGPFPSWQADCLLDGQGDGVPEAGQEQAAADSQGSRTCVSANTCARRGTQEVRQQGGFVLLHELGQFRCIVCCEGSVRKDGEPSAGNPEEIEEGRQVIMGAEQVTWTSRGDATTR